MLAPLLLLTSDNAEFRLSDQDAWQTGSIQLLGYNSSGPAGALSPGARRRHRRAVPAHQPGGARRRRLPAQVRADDSQPMDWAAQEAGLPLPTIPAAALARCIRQLRGQRRQQVGSYHAALAADETYLGRLGQPTSDVLQLVSFEIEKANAAFTAETLVSVTADDLPAPGLDLTFEQSYLQSIGGRYYQGILGLG